MSSPVDMKPAPKPTPAPAPSKPSGPSADKTASKTTSSTSNSKPTAPAPATKTSPEVKSTGNTAPTPPAKALASKEVATQSKNNFIATTALAKKDPAPTNAGGAPGPTSAAAPLSAATRDGSDVKFRDGKVVIYDGFTGSSNFIDFNSDGVGDISHGNVVKNVLEAQGVPANKIITVDKGPNQGEDLGTKFLAFAKGIDANKGTIAETTGAGAAKKTVQTPVSAVNLSQSTFTPIAEVGETLKLKGLTPENLLERRTEIRDALSDFAAKNPDSNYADYWKGVQGVDLLTKNNIPVYVAGGNGGRNDVNLLSLGNGTVNVAATLPLDAKASAPAVTSLLGGLAPGSGLGGLTNAAIAAPKLTPQKWTQSDDVGTADNALIKRSAQGVYPIKEVKAADGKVTGFNFTGGKRTDVPLSAVYDPALHDKLYEKFGEAPGYRPPVDRAFRGTSFAAPNALGSDYARFFGLTAPAKK